MKIQSETVEMNYSTEEAFRFLVDFNNFEKLIPRDKISNWQSTNKECSFSIDGLAKVGMLQKNTNPFSEINIVSQDKSPFDFTLDVFIEDGGAGKSKTHLVFQADVNPFMKMMIEKPLTNFFNMMAGNMKSV